MGAHDLFQPHTTGQIVAELIRTDGKMLTWNQRRDLTEMVQKVQKAQTQLAHERGSL